LYLLLSKLLFVNKYMLRKKFHNIVFTIKSKNWEINNTSNSFPNKIHIDKKYK